MLFELSIKFWYQIVIETEYHISIKKQIRYHVKFIIEVII